MYPGNPMALAPCSCTATFSGARRTSQYLRPSRTWSLRKSTSWTTRAGDGMALVSTRRTTMPPACTRRHVQVQTDMMDPSFDVTSPDDYNNFQQHYVTRMHEKLRDQVTPYVHLVDSGTGHVAYIARLPQQVDAPKFMDLTLHAGQENSVTLRVRTDNLYVVGFCNRKGRWFELRGLRHDGDRASLIPGSTNLRFDGRYDQGGIGELSKDDAILGRGAVEDAIKGLSSFQGTDYDVNVPPRTGTPHLQYQTDRALKGFLRVLIVNFIESLRFDTIAVQVANQMRNPSEEDDAQRRLDAQQTVLIRNWGGLSHALMQAVNNPALREGYLRSFNSAGVPNLVEAGRVLGMARASRWSGHNVGAIGGGLTLAEVVEVVIHNGNLDGTIKVTDGFGKAFDLYNNAQLVQPPRPISGADDFVIDVNLNRRAALVQVAVWNSREALSSDYNRILNGRVTPPPTHENCEVEVKYAVLTDAVVAALEVVLEDADVDVNGFVTATTTAMDSGQWLHYILLERAPGQPVARLPKNEAIPLQRKLVSAPLGSTLQISVDLRDQMVDQEIANFSVDFTPLLDGTDTAEIDGPRGKVRVNVTWSVSLPCE